MNNEYRMNKRSYKLAWWTQAIPNFILCVATLLLFLTSRHSVNERKKEREEMMKPYIAARICKADENYYLGLFNLGGGPAYNINVSYDPEILKSFSLRRLYHKDQFFSHVAHKSIFDLAEQPGPFQVVMGYKDKFGNVYNDRVVLDLKNVRFDTDMHILLAIREIGKSLDHISKNLPKSKK